MKFLLSELNNIIFAVGKALGAPTGNSTYDTLRNITAIGSLGIIILGLMSLRRDGKKHSKKIVKLRDDLMNAIKIFEAELADRKKGISGESTEEQLEKEIIPELKRVLANVNNSDIPDKAQRYLKSLENARTVWGWNMQNPTEICKLLTELDDRYNRLPD